MFICSYVLIHSLQVKLLSLCLFVHTYYFIHCRYNYFLYDSLFLCIDSSISGKTMENLRNRSTADLVTSEEKLTKLAAQPSFKQFKIFDENLVAAERTKVELTLNWPIYEGFAILDLSKTLMYDFRCNRIKRKYPGSTLLFTDTDSLKFKLITCMKTSMPVSIYSTFLGSRKKAHSKLMKTKK